MESQISVTFQPQGRTISMLRGATVLEAAARVGLVIETPCGGGGTCGKCRIQITANADSPTEADKAAFSEEELDSGWRLACQQRIESAMTVFVPDTSLFGRKNQILSAADSNASTEVLPAIRKIYVELSPPTLEDDAPDLLRLEQSIGLFRANLPLVRHA
ncbi:MAG: 2Fe-2S iron-sulfur cluster binding domain-containing protein, partial [Victivallales bacterium]|nr:2Fe-2S iron-sulfur cluster binding domain-containing protein [Victivallales bacterium]